ncbi:MAG: hypothetical protein QGH37_26500 [Candidatus Poribacteria bacterium]|nr:hypothetical protein [Candidatus Poribacteria bacterium]MDP6961401.1 hypothetical protein [Dehalococcoidia bacterium]
MRNNIDLLFRSSLSISWQLFFLASGMFFSTMNIAFSQEPVIAFSMGHQHSNIFLTDAEGKLEPLNITQKEAVGQRNGHPTWSPDGTRIAFDSNRKSKANYEIFVIDTDGANLKNLTKSEKDDKGPTWSPKGDKICFKSKRDGNWEIYVMTTDGQNPLRLTNHPKTDKEPNWSPDGKSIVFTSNRNGGNWDIYKMNIDEQNVVRLTDDTAKDDRASWSPDGKQIAFTSTREGKGAGIYLMDAIDGQNIKRIVKAGVAPYWSPDSMKIVFTAPAQPLRLAIWDLVKKKEMDTGIVAHIYFPSWKGSQ